MFQDKQPVLYMRIRNVTHAGKAVIRRCAGCGAMKDRRDMIRIIRSQDGKVLVDETRKRNGRGKYNRRKAGSEAAEAAAASEAEKEAEQDTV